MSKRASNQNQPCKKRRKRSPSAANEMNEGTDLDFKQIILGTIARKDVISFEDIVGSEEAKHTLFHSVVLPFLRPELYQGLRTAPNGILLFGPPGTGKTSLARAAASESGATFFNISAATLMCDSVGYCEKLIKALFVIARANQPSLIFFDEADSLLATRRPAESGQLIRMQNELLMELDGISTARNNKGVIVIGATNHPQDLDEAILSRFAIKIYIALPEKEGRDEQLHMLLHGQPHCLTRREIEFIATSTEGFSGRDLAVLAKVAALRSLKEITPENAMTIAAKDIRKIEMSDFIESLKLVKRSVSAESLKKFEEWMLKTSAYESLCYYN